MNKIFLKEIHKILSYNLWVNTRLIENVMKIDEADYIKKLPISFNSIQGLLRHLFYYEAKYYYKIVEKELTPKIDTSLSRALLSDAIQSCSRKWLSWVNTLIGEAEIIDQSEDTAEKIINLNLHNSYHRGQINIFISMLGYHPESVDIFPYNNLINPSS